jgi:hypothetical protein
MTPISQAYEVLPLKVSAKLSSLKLELAIGIPSSVDYIPEYKRLQKNCQVLPAAF